MIKTLCTFPGRLGDLLWALPSVRALAIRLGGPNGQVDLAVSPRCRSLAPVIQQQPYIRDCLVLQDWAVEEGAPMTPREPPTVPLYQPAPGEPGVPYNLVVHLGYRGWPLPDVLRHTLETLNLELAAQGVTVDGAATFGQTSADLLQVTETDLRLDRPWMRVKPHGILPDLIYGFTDEHFELKYGLVQLLYRKPRLWTSMLPPISVGENPRWQTESGVIGTPWTETLRWLQGCQVFLTDCSALHVMAVACGTPTILVVEPNPHRHNPVFYPLGMDGRVRVIRGVDGLPTWDARHAREAIREALGKIPQDGPRLPPDRG